MRNLWRSVVKIFMDQGNQKNKVLIVTLGCGILLVSAVVSTWFAQRNPSEPMNPISVETPQESAYSEQDATDSVSNIPEDRQPESEDGMNLDSAVPKWYTPGELRVITLMQSPSDSNLRRAIDTEKTDSMTLPIGTWSSSGLDRIQKIAATTKRVSVQASYIHPFSSNEKNIVLSTSRDDHTIILPSGSLVDANTSSDVDFITLRSSDKYPGGTDIYFDVVRKEIICFSHQVKTAVDSAGLLPSGGYTPIHYSDPASGNCIFEIRTAQHQIVDFYYYNIYSNKWAEFPVDLNKTFLLTFSPDKRYFATTLLDSDLVNNVILIDVSGNVPTKTNVSNNEKIHLNASHQVYFSNKSRYLVYHACDDNNQLYDENGVPHLAIYNIQEQTTIRTTGNFVRFINDDRAVLLESQGIGKVLDSTTGEDITDTVELENWQKYKIRVSSKGNPGRGYTQSATLVPLFDLSDESTPIENVSAIFASDEYIYYYMAGDDDITCYSIENQKSFTVAVDESFLSEIAKIDPTTTRILYHIDMSLDMTKLLLSYTTDKMPDVEYSDTEFADEEIGVLFREVSCLTELRDYVDSGKDLRSGGEYDPKNSPYNGMDKFHIVQGRWIHVVDSDCGPGIFLCCGGRLSRQNI
jgi:hypothetical protein